MSYTVLARRYRSRSFKEVVGQEAIARTLGGAIESGRVAHAYLFVGTRGVGKTSMARILAKALNGGSPEVDEAIMKGQDTDVIEIDAASHGSVDEARELIANSVYRPLRGQHKIYIIDEVHMLSQAAFNALLKTMEEPPPHVKFILCTTEPHKVPATIQSRCQRFDFRNIPTRDIARHLEQVLEREGVEAEPELVMTVARMGEGSMRDALSLMDRLLAAGESPVTLDLLERLLGLPDRSLLLGLLGAVSEGDVGETLRRGDELLARGVAIEQALESLLTLLRDVLVLCACGERTELVEVAGDSRDALVEIADRFDDAGLVHMIALVESVQRHSRGSVAPRALFDALLARLAMTERVADLASLVSGGGVAASVGGGRRKKA